MKKISPLLILPIVVLSIVSGLLLFQLSVIETENSELRTQYNEIQNQLDEQQSHKSELENELLELENQIDELQSIVDAPKAKIVDFSSPNGWWNPVGVTMAITFEIIIVNVGLCDIEDVIVEISWNNSEGDHFNRTRNFEILKSGEIVEFREDLFISIRTYSAEFYYSNFVATIISGDRILDESMLEITKRQF